MTPEAREVLSTLRASGLTWKQEPLASTLDLDVRTVQRALQELRLGGSPIVSDGDGVRLATDPAEVRACAKALQRRAVHQMLTARAMRHTAVRMAPLTLGLEGVA
jgi:hypothetical protein